VFKENLFWPVQFKSTPQEKSIKNQNMFQTTQNSKTPQWFSPGLFHKLTKSGFPATLSLNPAWCCCFRFLGEKTWPWDQTHHYDA